MQYPSGHYKLSDLETMSKYINQVEPKHNLVEVGCYLGRSTSVLASYARKHNQLLHCVDPFYGCAEPPTKEVVVYEFFKNMKKLRLLEHIRVYPMRSETFIELHLPREHISILHLDGDHHSDAIKLEMRWLADKTDDLVIMHDTDRAEVRSCFPGLRNRFIKAHETEMMTIFKRYNEDL